MRLGIEGLMSNEWESLNEETFYFLSAVRASFAASFSASCLDFPTQQSVPG